MNDKIRVRFFQFSIFQKYFLFFKIYRKCRTQQNHNRKIYLLNIASWSMFYHFFCMLKTRKLSKSNFKFKKIKISSQMIKFLIFVLFHFQFFTICVLRNNFLFFPRFQRRSKNTWTKTKHCTRNLLLSFVAPSMLFSVVKRRFKHDFHSHHESFCFYLSFMLLLSTCRTKFFWYFPSKIFFFFSSI